LFFILVKIGKQHYSILYPYKSVSTGKHSYHQTLSQRTFLPLLVFDTFYAVNIYCVHLILYLIHFLMTPVSLV